MKLPSIRTINAITKWVVIGPMILWAVWELTLLWLRKHLGNEVRLISMEGRRLAFQGLASIAYFSAGLSAHIYVTWHRPTWEGNTATVLGLAWWLTGLAYFLADIFDPNHLYWPIVTQWLRYPPIVACIGAAMAVTCFPQDSMWVPGFTR